MIAAPPPAGLTVSPPRVELAPAAGAVTVHVRNPTGTDVTVDVTTAALALSLDGRPRIATGGRGAAVVARPRTLALGPGSSGALAVSARVVGRVRPGDHPELLVLTTRPGVGRGVGVRLRIGVPVVVRVPGAIVHRLAVERMRLLHGALVVVRLRNRGNLVERITPTVTLVRRGRVVGRSPHAVREILPGAEAVVRLRIPRHADGPARVLVRLYGRVARVWRLRLP